MTRRRVLTAVAALLLLPVVLVLLAHVLLAFALPLDRVLREVTTTLGTPVEAARVSAWVLPRPRVRLHDVSIGGGLSIRDVEVVLRVGDLLGGRFSGSEARLHQVELTVVRRPDGIEIEGLRLSQAPQPGDPPPSEPGPWRVPALPPLHLRDVVVHYRDQTAEGGPATSHVRLAGVELATDAEADSLAVDARGRLDTDGGDPNLRVTATLGAPAPKKRPIRISIETTGLDPVDVPRHLPAKWGIRATAGSMDAKIDLAWNAPEGFEGALDLHFTPGEIDYAGIDGSGEVRFQGKLHNQGKFHMSDGILHAERAKLGRLDARDAEALFSHRDRVVRFDELSFSSWEGEVQATGTVTVGKPLSFALEIEARDLSVHSLTRPQGGAPPAEVIRMDVRGPVHGDWIDGDGWLDPIQGRLEVAMHGGAVLSGEMVEALVRDLPNRLPSKHEPGRERPMGTTPLERLEASFTLGGGRARTEDLLLVTEDYRVETAGWLDGDADYRFEGSLSFTPRGFIRLLRAASIKGAPMKRAALPPCPFAITGNFRTGHFHVQLDDEPLTALVVLPWTLHEFTDSTLDLIEAGRSGVDKTVDFFEELDEPKPDAPRKAR